MGVTVMRAEMFQGGEPIFIDIGSVTAEKRDAKGAVHVFFSRVT